MDAQQAAGRSAVEARREDAARQRRIAAFQPLVWGALMRGRAKREAKLKMIAPATVQVA